MINRELRIPLPAKCVNRLELRGKGHLGFTLAEVLITIGIIGVVAALTMPTLIANSRKTEYSA